MKKLISVILSLMMVVCSLTCLFTGTATAATTAAKDMQWTCSDSTYTMTAQTDVVYDKGPAWVAACHFRSYYTRINLDANTAYTLTMYTKNLDWNGLTNSSVGKNYNQFCIVSSLGSDELDFAKAKAATTSSYWNAYKGLNNDHVAEGATCVYASYFHDVGATVVGDAEPNSEESWYKVNINFTTTSATEYIIVMPSIRSFGSKAQVYISDLNLSKQCTVSATAEGNGTATVDKTAVLSGETVKFTAATSNGSTFLGWYKGTTKVSPELEYSTTVTDILP